MRNDTSAFNRNLQYNAIGEIPDALAALSVGELADLMESRLSGKTAGLPSLNRDEDPGDILVYAYREGGAAFRERFIAALIEALLRQLADLSKDVPLTHQHRYLLSEFFLLVSLTESRQVLPTLEGIRAALEQRGERELEKQVLGCILRLIGPEQKWMKEALRVKVKDFDQCGLALTALFQIDPDCAAAELSTVAETLLCGFKKTGEAPISLARVLVLLLPPLPHEKQVGFLRAAKSVKMLSSVEKCILHALDQMTSALAPQSCEFLERWKAEAFRETLVKTIIDASMVLPEYFEAPAKNATRSTMLAHFPTNAIELYNEMMKPSSIS